MKTNTYYRDGLLAIIASKLLFPEYGVWVHIIIGIVIGAGSMLVNDS